MKKLIIIEDNSEIQVGDLVKGNPGAVPTSDVLGIVAEIKTHTLYLSNNRWINKTQAKKVQLYIVDTTLEEEIDENSICMQIETYEIIHSNSKILESSYLIDKNGITHYTNHDPWWIVKVICTSNPSLPLPQLSKQAIELVVENNGELEEFDIKFYEKRPKRGTYYYEKANIIPRSNKPKCQYCGTYKETTIGICSNCARFPTNTSIIRTHPNGEFCLSYKHAKQLGVLDEWNTWKLTSHAEDTTQSIKEVAEIHSNKYYMPIGQDDLIEAFIAGAKSNAAKEYHTKNMYSEDEVKALTFKAMQDITSLHFLPKITDITEWFENNKKK